MKEAVASTGNVLLFPGARIPKSTVAGWVRGQSARVVTDASVDAHTYELLNQVERLKTRLKRQAAIIVLLVRILKFGRFRLHLDRIPDAGDKSKLLRIIQQAAKSLPLKAVLSVIGLSNSRYHSWIRRARGCGLEDECSCPRSFPTRMLSTELLKMKELVLSKEHRHMSVRTLALYAQRTGQIFASAQTWYKKIREHSWKRPRVRLHPAKPKIGLRATRANEYWHIDVSVIRLLSGTRIYLQAVMDNYSRKILAWRVSESKTAEITRELLTEAQKNLTCDQQKPAVVIDDGPENYGDADSLFEDDGPLNRLLAQGDIVESNSLIEAWWSQLKHMWLFLHSLDTIEAVRRLAAYYVQQHNEVMPRVMLGARTPDEVYLGLKESITAELADARKSAQSNRIKRNQEQRCGLCESPKPEPLQRTRKSERESAGGP